MAIHIKNGVISLFGKVEYVQPAQSFVDIMEDLICERLREALESKGRIANGDFVIIFFYTRTGELNCETTCCRCGESLEFYGRQTDNKEEVAEKITARLMEHVDSIKHAFGPVMH